MENTVLQEMQTRMGKIQNVRFRTPSPRPDVPIVTVGAGGMLFYANYPYLNWDKDITTYTVTLYLAEQVKILCHNNPGYLREEIKSVLSSRILNWKHNQLIQKFCKRDETIIDTALDWYYKDLEYINPEYTMKTTWYGDAIENLPGEERKSAKARARSERNSLEYREGIKESSDAYRFTNFDIKPTIKYLDDDLTMSRTTIKKHGEGLYIGTKMNVGGRVNNARKVYPEYTQGEIAELLELSRMTVNTYWNK